MPTLDVYPLEGRDSFVRGVPGLDFVVVEGNLAIFHKNPKAVKAVHRLEIRFCGATTTKVRPKTVFGLRGKKFKGRWNHVGSPPVVFFGGGALGSEPLFLHPGEAKIFPFSFRFGKHQAAIDMPPSIVLPNVGELRSRGETRYWLEARMGWRRKGNIRASRRVGVEVWMDWMGPSTLSNMLANRLPLSCQKVSAESIGSSSSSFLGVAEGGALRKFSKDSIASTVSSGRFNQLNQEASTFNNFPELSAQEAHWPASSLSADLNSLDIPSNPPDITVRETSQHYVPALPVDISDTIVYRTALAISDIAPLPDPTLSSQFAETPSPPPTMTPTERRYPIPTPNLANPSIGWQTPAYKFLIDRSVISGGDSISISAFFSGTQPATGREANIEDSSIGSGAGAHPITLSDNENGTGRPPQPPPRPLTPKFALKGLSRTMGELFKADRSEASEMIRGDKNSIIGRSTSPSLNRKQTSVESANNVISSPPRLPSRPSLSSSLQPFQSRNNHLSSPKVTVEVSIEERVVLRAPVDADHADAVLAANPVFHESAVGIAMSEETPGFLASLLGSDDLYIGQATATSALSATGPYLSFSSKDVSPEGSVSKSPSAECTTTARKRPLLRLPTPPDLAARLNVKTSQRSGSRVFKNPEGGPDRWVKAVESRREVRLWKWSEELSSGGGAEQTVTVTIPPIFSAPDVASPPEGLLHPYSDDEDENDSISPAEASTTIIPSPDYSRNSRGLRKSTGASNNSIRQATPMMHRTTASTPSLNKRRESELALTSRRIDEDSSMLGTRNWKSDLDISPDRPGTHLRNAGTKSDGALSRLKGAFGFFGSRSDKSSSTASVGEMGQSSTIEKPRVKVENEEIYEGLHPTSHHSIISVEHRYVVRLQGYFDPALGRTSAATLIAPVTISPLDVNSCRRLATEFRLLPEDNQFLLPRASSRNSSFEGKRRRNSGGSPLRSLSPDSRKNDNSPTPTLPPRPISQSSTVSHSAPALLTIPKETKAGISASSGATLRRSNSGALILSGQRASSPLSRSGDWDAEHPSSRKLRRPASYPHGIEFSGNLGILHEAPSNYQGDKEGLGGSGTTMAEFGIGTSGRNGVSPQRAIPGTGSRKSWKSRQTLWRNRRISNALLIALIFLLYASFSLAAVIPKAKESVTPSDQAANPNPQEKAITNEPAPVDLELEGKILPGPEPSPIKASSGPPKRGRKRVKKPVVIPERPVVALTGIRGLVDYRILAPMIGPGCSSSLLTFHLFDIPCIRLFISKALGFGLVLGGAIIKVPQIFKIMMRRSAAGVSFASYALETSAYIAGLAYNVRQANPFNTYGEHAFMAVANVVVVMLMFHYKSQHKRLAAVLIITFIFSYSLFDSRIISDSILLSLQWVAILIGVFSKVPQILENRETKSTGQLSAVTVGLQTVGSLARCYTTVTEVGDPVILITYVVATVLNGVVSYQIWLYWGRPRRSRKD
ncbi:hypothetical protein HDU67_003264 [Dinochytrium kinnereticum]|nr:hypothetical protein HDU67_003264 [Dinochytrium kinnereticum]